MFKRGEAFTRSVAKEKNVYVTPHFLKSGL